MNLTKSHRSGRSTLTIVLKSLLIIATIVPLTLVFITIGAAGIVPARYLIAAIFIVVVLVGLIGFLLFKRFRRFNPFAKTVAVILSVIIIAASVFGYNVLSRSLSILDRFAGAENSVAIETKQPFNVYISGIDTYGDLTAVSRSDVNIVATVNPNTNKILLTTIPRDSYVPIALGGNDQMDKLTHAGNYGVESSMTTVANLLDTKIDTYVRVNFTSFVDVIDKLGGVTIDNPVAFESYGEYFEKGTITLDGKRALVYSRERKGLEGGDNDRGKNQQRVIQGVVDGISQVRSLTQLESLLILVSDSVDTNVAGGSVRELLNEQISSGKSWTTESIAISGKGQTGGLPSYAMPSSSLYMFVLDEASLESVKSRVNQALAPKE